MFVIIALGFTLLLAVFAMRLAAAGMRCSLKQGLARLSCCAALTVFLILYGAWVYLSIYADWAVVIAVLVAAIMGAVRQNKRTLAPMKNRAPGYFGLAVLFAALDVLYFTGTTGPTHSVSLRPPLKGGRYIVLQGGKGLPANAFHFSSRRAVYAMDFAKLDRWGRRGRYPFSTRRSDYYIWGDTVYAPCAGRVIRAVQDNPDNTPPERKRGPHNLNGVVIEGSECTVFLGHMQQGRVFVQEGEVIAAGTPIGLAGNSGMSIEPHLHMQAHQKATDGRPWYEQPQLFMAFDDRIYLLFETIDWRR